MHIKTVTCLSEIIPDACIQTNGSKPLRVLCDDFNFYICKYHRGHGPAYSLFNEYFASCLLKKAEIASPDFAFVKINREHIKQIQLPYYYFDKPCYGSFYRQENKDVERIFSNIPFNNP